MQSRRLLIVTVLGAALLLGGSGAQANDLVAASVPDTGGGIGTPSVPNAPKPDVCVRTTATGHLCPEDVVEDARDEAEDAAEEAKDAAEDAVDAVKEAIEDVLECVEGLLGDSPPDCLRPLCPEQEEGNKTEPKPEDECDIWELLKACQPDSERDPFACVQAACSFLGQDPEQGFCGLIFICWDPNSIPPFRIQKTPCFEDDGNEEGGQGGSSPP